MSQAGTISSGSGPTPPTGQFLVYEVSPTIDFTVAQTNNIFTTGALTRFTVIAYSILVDTLSGYVSSGIFNLGFTGPAYDDYLQTAVLVSNMNPVNYYTTEYISPAEYPVIPTNTTLVMNITSGVNATTATGRIFVMGFYF